MRIGQRTPWGAADHVDTLAEGVYEVQTPGHGGIAIDVRSSAFLSPEALSVGERMGGHIFFEEDCAFAAVYVCMPALWRRAVALGYKVLSADVDRADAPDEVIEAFFRRWVETWYPDEYGVPCSFCERGDCYKHGPQYKGRGA